MCALQHVKGLEDSIASISTTNVTARNPAATVHSHATRILQSMLLKNGCTGPETVQTNKTVSMKLKR